MLLSCFREKMPALQSVVEVTGETPLTISVGGQLSVSAVSESR